METIKGYKGFDKDLKCRGFQYKVGEDFEQDGPIRCCNNGFHFCENPLDVLSYYPPSEGNRFCKVEGSGKIDKADNDSKVATSKLHISAEIGLNGLIKAGVKFILDRVKWEDSKATNTGYKSAATNTGNYSAATNTGDQAIASVNEAEESIAIVTGKDSSASGSLGCWIVLTERGEWNGNGYPIIEVKAFKVDGKKIKPDTRYKLVEGEAVEVNK